MTPEQLPIEFPEDKQEKPAEYDLNTIGGIMQFLRNERKELYGHMTDEELLPIARQKFDDLRMDNKFYENNSYRPDRDRFRD